MIYLLIFVFICFFYFAFVYPRLYCELNIFTDIHARKVSVFAVVWHEFTVEAQSGQSWDLNNHNKPAFSSNLSVSVMFCFLIHMIYLSYQQRVAGYHHCYMTLTEVSATICHVLESKQTVADRALLLSRDLSYVSIMYCLLFVVWATL